jgi:hypothetical protein
MDQLEALQKEVQELRAELERQWVSESLYAVRPIR